MSTLTTDPATTIITAAIRSALDHYEASKRDSKYDENGQEEMVGANFDLAKGLAWVALEVQATLTQTWPTVPAPSNPARTDWGHAMHKMLDQARDGYYLAGFVDAGRN